MIPTALGRRVPCASVRPATALLRGAIRCIFAPAVLALGVLLALPAAALRAADAPATGAITGRVANADNGTYLNNARIEVEGTSLATFTNRYGEYRLESVPAGPAKLDVFFTGMAPKSQTVQVTAGQTAQADIRLSAKAAATETGEEASVLLDTFVVASERDTNQRSIAINEQRFSPTIKTVVSTDQFGDITEGNIGEFVKFLPGITVGYTASDVRNISIRGVGSQYTAILLDGYRVASADSGSLSYSSTGGGTRTTELEQISINNAARAEIVKARTPDLPGDALGGSLNLVSKSAFEYTAPQFDYRVFGSMNSESTSLGSTPGLRSDATSHKVLPSFDFTLALPVSKRLGFTLSFLDSNIFNPQYRSNPQWSPSGTYSAPSGAPADLGTNPFLQKYTMQDGPKTTHRKALELTADWKISDRDVLSLRFQDNFYNSEFGNRNINFDAGSAMPLAYSPTSTSGALGKGAVSFGSSFRNKYGVTYNLGADYVHTGSEWTFNAGMNFSHASTHYDDVKNGYFSSATYKIANATVGYADYDGVAPQTITVTDATGANTLGNVFDVTNPNYVLTAVGANPVDAVDSFFTQKADLKRRLDLAGLPTTVKFGVQTQFERRDVDNYKVAWSPAGALALPGAAGAYGLADSVYNLAPPFIPYSIVWPSSAKLYQLYQDHPDLFTASSGNAKAAALGSVLFKERISAAYAMGDTEALDAKLRVIYGVRVERTDAEGWGPLSVNGTYQRRGSHAKNDYTDAFPSATITYKICDNLILRAAYDRAIGRPDLGNIVPNISLPDITVPGSTVSVSNPLLKPEYANNFDLSLEYYFGQSVVSLGAFRKDFSNFWGKKNVAGADALAILNSLGVPDAQTYIDQGDLVSTTINSGTAHITGVEFAYQQSLDNLAPVLHGTSVFANATGIQLQGAENADFSAFVSESVNWGVSYNNRRLSAKLNWNYRGRERNTATAVTVGGVPLPYREYFAPRLYLDANLEIRLTKHVGLFFNGRNLTNVPQDDERYAKGVTPSYAKLYRREMFGTAFTFGLKGTF